MDPSRIDDDYVTRTAHGVDLKLAPAHVAGVVRYFKMIADMAESVNAFPLDETTDPAAIFAPCPAPTRD
jgi:Asp-tRNA(Asn)/Glu-tRNA(Gln) amidotransferase C subunit